MKQAWLWFTEQRFYVKLLLGALAVFAISVAAALMFSVVLSLVASAILYPPEKQ